MNNPTVSVAGKVYRSNFGAKRCKEANVSKIESDVESRIT